MTARPLAAFAVASVGIAVFGAMDALVKGLSIAIGTYDALFWRSIAGVPLAGLPWALRRRAWPRGQAMRLHVERGIVSAAMTMLFFWGLARTPMAQAVAFTFIAPLLAVGLAALLLDERPPRGALWGAATALVGVAVLVAGHRAAPSPLGGERLGAIAILLSACCYAYNLILMRRQAQIADPFEVAFFQNLMMALCLGLAAPFLARVPGAQHVPAILASALFASISLALLSWAYARAPASHLANSEYTALVWSSVYGWWIFGEPVRLVTLMGGALIIAGCVVAARAGVRPAPGELPA